MVVEELGRRNFGSDLGSFVCVCVCASILSVLSLVGVRREG